MNKHAKYLYEAAEGIPHRYAKRLMKAAEEIDRLYAENAALKAAEYRKDKSELDYVKKECEGLWDTFLALGDKLGIDTEEARSASGKPSDVFLKHIQKRDLLMKAEALEGILYECLDENIDMVEGEDIRDDLAKYLKKSKES